MRSISRALSLAQPGDAIVLAAGAYVDPVTISVAGSRTAPISIEARPGTDVFVRSPWTLTGASFLVVRGLRFESPTGLGWIVSDEATHDVRLLGNSFDSSNPTAGDFLGMRLRGAHLELCGNVFGSWLGDEISAEKIDGLLVENNDFSQASAEHALLTVWGQRVVIRGNVLRNPWQRTLHITDRNPDLTQDVLVEGNTFIASDWTKGTPHPSAVAYDQGGNEVVRFLGANGIFRNNLLVANNEGNDWPCHGILAFTTFRSEAGVETLRYRDFRVYGNTFHGNRTSAITAYRGEGGELEGNVFRNNVLSASERFGFHACNPGVPWKTYLFERNLISGSSPGVVQLDDLVAQPKTVPEIEQAFPEVFQGSLAEAPVFVDDAFGAMVRDAPSGFRLEHRASAFEAYSLAAGSPGKGGIARLASLAQDAVDTAQVVVTDALPFSDGFSMTQGDLIVIGTQEARVTGRLLATKVLTLDRNVTAPRGASIFLGAQREGGDVGIHRER